MLGLILKDIINLKKNVRLFALFFVIYGVVSVYQRDASFFGSIFTMLFAILVLSTFSYDEMAKFDCYALTMPLSRKSIIQGKYLIMLLLTLFGLVVNTIFTLILNTILKTELTMANIQSGLIGVAIVIFFYCIVIPIITKFGIERARIILMFVYFIPFLVGILINQLVKGKSQPPEGLIEVLNTLVKNIYVIVPIVLILSLGLSYYISKRIYEKKEF